jgi:Protein of unknown function (DUF4065)
VADIKFNPQKLRELVLYVAEREFGDPKFGKVKLLKILWLSDFLAYGQLGTPITGATYRHLDNGPGPKELPDLLKEMEEAGEASFYQRDYFGRSQKRLLAYRSPNLDVFSPQEIALVDEVIESVWDYNGIEISDLSHGTGLGVGWRLTRRGEEIPYESVFLSEESLTDQDIQRGQEVARDHGWLSEETA